MAENINRTLEDLRDAIRLATQQMEECCGPKGSKTGAGPSNPPPAYGSEDDDYPDRETFFDARCNASNGIYDTLLGVAVWFEANHVDYKAGVFGALTTGLTFALLAAGPAGWAITAGGTAITAIVTWVLKESLDFGQVETALDDKHEELVKSLYNATTVTQAKDDFMAILETATPTLNSGQLFLIWLMLTNDVLNNVFDPREDLAIYESDDPIVCGDAPLAIWTYAASGQGWTFEDQSTAGQSTDGNWISARQAWEIELTIAAAPGGFAQGRIYLDGLSIPVGVGNSVHLDYSATSDGLNSFQQMIVTYTDLTQDTAQTSGSTSGAGTLILNIPASKTIEEISVSAKREYGDYFYTIDFEEVRVV
jgi:hypothetical protein